MHIKKILSYIFVIFCLNSYCQTIKIASIKTSRELVGGWDNGYTLDGTRMTRSRLKLLDTNNFGPTGTYSKNIIIYDNYGTSGSLTGISNVSVNNIFFFGAFNKLNASMQQFTTAEIDSLYNWSLRGGKLIVTAGQFFGTSYASNILNWKWGFTWMSQVPSGLGPTWFGNATDIFNGPFGNVNWAYQGGGAQGFFNTIPANSRIFAKDANGNTTLYMDCNTLDLVVADVDAYTDLGGLTPGAGINNNQDRFWANTIVFMDKLPPLPKITNSSNVLSLNSSYTSYQWYYNDSPLFNSVTPSFTVSDTGKYYVEVTFPGGCKVKSNELKLASVHFAATTNSTNITCNGLCDGAAIAIPNNGIPPYSYNWNTNDTTNEISGLCPGTYTCVVKDSVNNTVVVSVTITEPTELVANASQIHGICNNTCTGSASINALGGTLQYTYLWTSSGETGSIATSLCEGNNDVIVIDVNGCRDTTTVTIGLASSLNAIILGDTNVCPGNMVTLFASGGSDYKWNNGSTDSSITVSPSLTNNIYSVIVKDDYGCSDTANVTIDLLLSPNITISGDTIICLGDSTTIFVSGGGNYSWNIGSIDSSITVSPILNSVYSVNVTTDDGCTDTKPVLVIVNSLPVNLFAGNDTLICMYDSAKIGMGVISGVNETFNWAPSSGLSCVQCPNPIASPSITTTYLLTTTTSHGCYGRDSVEIVVNPPIDTSVSVSGSTLTANIFPATYQWINCSDQYTPVGGAINQSFTVTTNYYYAVIVTQNGCSDTSSCFNIDSDAKGIIENSDYPVFINIYPNPYTGSTSINYILIKKSDVNVEVYNTIGQKVETLLNTNQPAGEYKYTFSAKEKGFDAGVYFVKITVDGKVTMKRIVEMR